MIRLAKAHRRSAAGRPRGGPVAGATGGARRSRATRAPRRTGPTGASVEGERSHSDLGRRQQAEAEVRAESRGGRVVRQVVPRRSICRGAVLRAGRKPCGQARTCGGFARCRQVGDRRRRARYVQGRKDPASQGRSSADLGASREVTLGIADGAGRIGRNGMASHRRRKGVKTPKRSPFAVSTFSGSWMSTPRWRRKSTPSRSSAAATASSRRQP